MNAYDPEQIKTNYIEQRNRNRRAQVPPLSYWQKYEEMDDEEEFCRAMTDEMDAICAPFLVIAPMLLLLLIGYHLHLFWLSVVAIALGLPLLLWHIWGR